MPLSVRVALSKASPGTVLSAYSKGGSPPRAAGSTTDIATSAIALMFGGEAMKAGLASASSTLVRVVPSGGAEMTQSPSIEAMSPSASVTV